MSKLAAGYYKGRAVKDSAQYGYAKEGGEQISIELQLDVGQTVTTILSFSGGAIPYSIERLKALGWDGSNELNGIERNEVDVQIKYELKPGTNDEQMRAEIKTTGGRFSFKTPMNDQQRRGFMANLANTAKQYEQGAGQQQTQQRQPDASGTNFPHGANAPPQTQPYKL